MSGQFRGQDPVAKGPNLLDLPLELLVTIMLYVDREDRCHLSQVCKTMKQVVDNPVVWHNRNLELTDYPKGKFKRHFWNLIKNRNLTTVSLTTHLTIPVNDVQTLLRNCPNLRSISCSCNVIHCIATQNEDQIPALEEVRVYFKDCYANLQGSCLKSLSRLKHLRRLRINKLFCVDTLFVIFQHIQHLTQLETLEVKAWLKESDLDFDEPMASGFTISDLSELKRLTLSGIPVDKNMFLPPIEEEESSEEEPKDDGAREYPCLEQLSLSNVLDLEWLTCVTSVTHLSVMLKASQVNTLIKGLKSNMDALTHLKILADGIGLYPVVFEDLPVTLTSFSLAWTVGGMVRKMSSVLQQISRPLRAHLQHLHLSQIRLTSQDLHCLPLEFTSIKTLSFSLSEEVQGPDLLHLASVQTLHTACLWFSLRDRFADYAAQVRQLSDNRVRLDFSASMSRLFGVE